MVDPPAVRQQAPPPPRDFKIEQKQNFGGYPPQEPLVQNQWGRGYGPGPNQDPQQVGRNRGNFNPPPPQNYGQPRYRNTPQQQQMPYNAGNPYLRGNQQGGGYDQGRQIPQTGGQRPPKMIPPNRRPREPEPVEECQLGMGGVYELSTG